MFVLTHHAHDPIEMEGGTTFHFVTDGIESAFEQAFAAAGGQDVRLNGGASTIQQYLAADLVDVLNVAIAPFLLGWRGAAVRRAGLPDSRLGVRRDGEHRGGPRRHPRPARAPPLTLRCA